MTSTAGWTSAAGSTYSCTFCTVSSGSFDSANNIGFAAYSTVLAPKTEASTTVNCEYLWFDLMTLSSFNILKVKLEITAKNYKPHMWIDT